LNWNLQTERFMYYLVRLDPQGDGFVENAIPDFGPFEEGSEAAKVAKILREKLGVKVQPRRIRQAPDWRARQAERLANGTLKPLPAKWDLEPIKDHFAHLSDEKPGMIGFIESDEMGIIDRPTYVTPGRYLARYYPQMNENDRKKYIAIIDPTGEVYFARTPDEIERIYEEGPPSCMSGKGWIIHPARAYAAGDLAVAYTMNYKGRIQERAVCFPEKKQIGRIYGDGGRLREKLLAEGWSQVSDFDGAKLLKIPSPGNTDTVVLPYFDNIRFAIDKGDYLLAAAGAEAGDYVASGGGTGGHSTFARYCPKLGCGANGPFYYVDGANEEWSAYACERYAFVCAKTGRSWPETDEYRVYMGGGSYWSKEAFEQHGAVCAMTGNAYPKSDMVQRSDGSWVHKSIADETPKKRKSKTKTVSVPLDAFADSVNRLTVDGMRGSVLFGIDYAA
jgi:hypothetical protein